MQKLKEKFPKKVFQVAVWNNWPGSQCSDNTTIGWWLKGKIIIFLNFYFELF